MANLFIPYLNPVRFYNEEIEVLDKYQTKHFEDYPFEERILPWQQAEYDQRIWQTTDIINLQFQSDYDPISVSLVDENENPVIELPAIIGLPNKWEPATYSFEVSMSLADLETGCYRIFVYGGGDVFKSPVMHISEEPIPNTILIEYWNSRFRSDVIFETGIKFQRRFYGHFKFLDKQRTDTLYRDQRFNPSLLQSKTARQWPLYFGNEFGISDDEIDLIHEIFSCDNVLIDRKPFGLADGKVEYVDLDNDYPKRGMKLMVEEGINRNSHLFSQTVDTTKKLMATIIVDARMFGDTANQNSANTIPVTNIEIE